MRRAWFGPVVLLLGVGTIPGYADDKAEKKADPKKDWQIIGTFQAMVLHVEESNKAVFLKGLPAIPDPAAQQKLDRAYKDAQTAFNKRDKAAYDEAMNRANQAQAQMSGDRGIRLGDGAKIRVAYPPPAFDEKGNPKKYTAAELKELKGTGEDAKLPGYVGEFGNLQSDQIVTITLTHKKGMPLRPKPDDNLDEFSPVISVIIIQPEPPKPPRGPGWLGKGG